MPARTDAELLAAIDASPHDDASRLVYADLLLERGDPRGELMHLQLERAKTTDEARAAALDARVKALVAQHHLAWLGVPYSPHITWTFERGFPAGRVGHAGLFVEDPPRDLGEQPVFACVRLFPGGEALAVSIGAAPTGDVLGQAAGWLVRGYDSGGPYRLTFRPGAAPLLEFSSTSRYGTVDYRGEVRANGLSLDWHSHINGADGHTDYTLVEVAGVDNRA